MFRCADALRVLGLSSQLLKDADVHFSGYKMPHPLFHKVEVRVQTNGNKTPTDAVSTGLNALIFEVDRMADQFQDQVNL